MICDICLVPRDTLWCFQVAEFTAHAPGGSVLHPLQHWGICNDCHDLMLAHDLNGLLDRTDNARLPRDRCEAFLSSIAINIIEPMVLESEVSQ